MPDHEVSFGFEGFWKTAYDAFPRFWDAYPRILEAFGSLTARSYENVNPLQKVSINLGILAATSLIEVTTLVGNGLGHGALKIARSMLEVAINAEFLRLHPAEVDNYIDYWLVERHKLMTYVRNDAPHLLPSYPQQLQNEVEAEFQAVKSRFEVGNPPRLRAGWCSTDLAGRAAKTDFQEAYRLIYPMGNKLLHGTIGGLNMHASKAVDTVRINVPPSLDYCKPALVGAHFKPHFADAAGNPIP
jgi:hypothetical protein